MTKQTVEQYLAESDQWFTEIDKATREIGAVAVANSIAKAWQTIEDRFPDDTPMDRLAKAMFRDSLIRMIKDKIDSLTDESDR